MSFSPPNEWTQGEAAFWAYLDGTVALALALQIERKDGARLCFTSAQRDVQLPGKSWGQIAVPAALHRAGEGVFPKSLQQSRDPRKVDNWEFTAFVSGDADAYIRQDDVLKGRFSGAAYSLRIYARDDLDWQLLRQRGELGERSLDKGACTWKMKGLSNKLAAEVLEVTSPLSRAAWGDEELAFFNLDGQTHDGFAARVTGAVSSVSAIWAAPMVHDGRGQKLSGGPLHRWTNSVDERPKRGRREQRVGLRHRDRHVAFGRRHAFPNCGRPRRARADQSAAHD